jgi:hypothetical protein
LTTNEWINRNYKDLLHIVENIVKDRGDIDDLFHCVMEQLLKGGKLDGMKDKERVYYFIRVLKNNYFSKTSPYYYQYKKNPHREEFKDIEFFEPQPDVEYTEELPDIEWVNKQLSHLEWFDRDLFLLWMELGSLTAVSRKTTIPLNSVGRYINQTKQMLIKKWEDRN